MGRLAPMRPRVAPASPTPLARPAKVARAFYRSKEWRDLVKRLRDERGAVCEKCGSGKGRIYADHKIELRDGGAALDPRNIELLCASCHGRKTARERAKRLGLA